MEKKYLYVISHTHWDREWYQSFQDFRVRLVRMMDDLLDVVEKGEFPCFHLDGQTIVLEDYLEIRPQNRQRLEKLIREGKLVIGPWYVMPDEFLVSGESLVRNLQLGHRLCSQWEADPMQCGYVTDIFGHNSQFPQILRGFGIDNALLYRGIGDYPKDAFNWQGADGSEVTAFKMDANRSYSNFYFAVRWPFEGRDYNMEEMVERMQKLFSYMEPQCNTDVMLMMDGVDHIDCEPEMPRLLKAMEEKLPHIHFVHTRFDEYKKAYMQRQPELETISGPLYHPGKYGINNQVLKNVLSSMIFLKQKNDQCERTLTSWAEPLDMAAWLLEDKLPQSDKVRSMEPRSDFHFYAWKTLLQNQPHDSICGCSIPDVHRDNVYRYRQSLNVAESSIKDSLRTLCSQINTADLKGQDGAVVLFNPSDRQLNGVVAVELELMDGQQKNFRFYDPDGTELPYQILSTGGYLQKTAELRQLIRFAGMPVYTIALPVCVPAHGYAAYSFDNQKTMGPGAGDYTYPVFYPPVRYTGTMRTAADTFDTGALLVKAESNGTLTVTEKRTGHVYTNLLLMEDGGDYGDGWVYRKPEMDSLNMGVGGNCDIMLEADGPLAAELKITKRLEIARRLDPTNNQRRSDETETLEVVSYVRLMKGSSRIEVRTVCCNRQDNHRLRVTFGTGLKGAKDFYTKTPYDMQKWSVAKEDCSDFTEKDTQENPSQGVTYIRDGEAAFGLYARGLYELECRDDAARTLALTLLRTTQSAGCDNDGSAIMHDTFTLEYCMDFAPGAQAAQAMIEGEAWRSGIRSQTCGKQAGSLPEKLAFYQVEGSGSTIVTAAVHTDWNGQNVIRLLNAGETPDEGVLTVSGPVKQAFAVDFRGNRLSELRCENGKIAYSLAPKKLLNIELCR